jgi:very-short-patch-repair endonuclease
METHVGSNPIVYGGCLDALTRRFRTPMGRSEALLWGELKGRKLRGYRFERKRQVDRYVVDFYCKELHLAIDLIGTETPWLGRRADEERTIRLRLCGVTYFPIGEEEVACNLDGVLYRIRQSIRFLPWK